MNTQYKSSGARLTLLGGYRANFRNFNRPIQSRFGAYSQGLVAEVEHDLNLGFKVPIGHGISTVGGAEAHYLLSNQEYSAAGLPNYSYYSVNLGLEWDWQAAQ